MSEAWVVNASPLILFARILIERLAPTVLIPNAVIQEVRAGQQKDRTAATALKWAEQYGVEDVALVGYHRALGSWARRVSGDRTQPRPSEVAVLDDRAARRCAVAQGIPIIGSLGVVLRSKKNRQIDRARPLVKELIAAGMFLDDGFVDRVLASVGE